MKKAGIKLVYPRETGFFPEILSAYNTAVTEKVRRYHRPVTILTIPGAEAFFIPGGHVEVRLPEFRCDKGFFNAGNNVLEILDLSGNRLERNYSTCLACYRLTGKVKKKRGGGYAERRVGIRIIHTLQCEYCTHEWEIIR
ncbi:MAG: hypothetical protein AAB428_02780 [Patescibacteria group bacterium]